MSQSGQPLLLPFSRLVLMRIAGWTGPFVIGGTIALMLSATWAGGNQPRVTAQDIQIDLPTDAFYGALPPNRALTVTVQVPEQPARQGETLVASFEGEGIPRYTVPLEPLPETRRLSATVDLGRLSSTIGSPPKATILHVTLGRQQGVHLEEIARRSVVVTIATPGYTDRSLRSERATGAVRVQDLAGQDSASPEGLAMLETGLQEEDLLGNASQGRQDGYWRQLQGLIQQRLRDELSPQRRQAVRRMPVIHFRLYANGEAQLIEVERSSGNVDLDQAALMTVVNAHPFPPFPTGTQDAPIDVHVDLPTLMR